MDDSLFFNIEINRAYKFYFKSPFDFLNDVYKVLGFLSYDEVLEQNIDIKKELYDGNGIDPSVWEQDKDKIPYTKYLKLQKLTDDTVILTIPIFLLEKNPDSNLIKCYDLALNFSIGIHKSIEDVDYLKDLVTQMLVKYIGLAPEDIKVVVYATKEYFITEDEWNNIVNDRKARQEYLTPFNELLKLQQELEKLRNIIAAYEEIIVQLSKK